MDGTSAYDEAAARAIANKSQRQIPEIDFTLHTMEDGSTVSTQERVCKGMLDVFTQRRSLVPTTNPMMPTRQLYADRLLRPRRAGARLHYPHR